MIVLNEFTKMSDSIEKLATALSKAQGEFKEPKKDKLNPHFNSYYASLASLREATIGGLSNNGLSISQYPNGYGDGMSSVLTILMHSSGQWISSELKLKARDSTAQPTGGSISYAARYSYERACGIAAIEDTDGNEDAVHQQPKPYFSRNVDPEENLPPLDGGYVIPIGYNKGKPISQLSFKSLQGDLDFWTNKAKQPIPPLAQEYVAVIKQEMARANSKVETVVTKHEGSAPPLNDQDFPF